MATSATKINFVTFPEVINSSEEGLLAMGGNLTIDTLVSAYRQGIFPWFNQDQPILWWSPDPRLVLFPSEMKISRSLKKRIRNQTFDVTANQAFSDVVQSCALRGKKSPKSESAINSASETWITESMKKAYHSLHKRGYAHSIEVWQQDSLVGGLYGLALGNVFFGESMFSIANDASKVALATLCAWLSDNDFSVIDCQVSNDHLISLGAREIARTEFLHYLDDIDIDQPFINFAQDITHYHADSVITQP